MLRALDLSGTNSCVSRSSWVDDCGCFRFLLVSVQGMFVATVEVSRLKTYFEHVKPVLPCRTYLSDFISVSHKKK